MKIVIDYKRWCRGGDGNFDMREADGRCCFLGFVGEQFGIPERDLREAYPVRDDDRWPQWARDYAPQFAEINDFSGTTDEEKLERLRDFLKGEGVTIEVINTEETA